MTSKSQSGPNRCALRKAYERLSNHALILDPRRGAVCLGGCRTVNHPPLFPESSLIHYDDLPYPFSQP
jgi:hypothetical protein